MTNIEAMLRDTFFDSNAYDSSVVFVREREFRLPGTECPSRRVLL